MSATIAPSSSSNIPSGNTGSNVNGGKKRKQDEITSSSNDLENGLHGNGSTTTSTTTAHHATALPKKMFWQWTVDEIGVWIRGLNAFFPSKPTRIIKDTTTAADGKKSSSSTIMSEEEYEKVLNDWTATVQTNETHVSFLIKAISSATTKQSNSGGYEQDEYNIMDSSFARGERVIHVPGALLSQLGIGGLTNALAGVPGGLVDPGTNIPLRNEETGILICKEVPKHVVKMSRILMRAISARLEMDMMESTPYRIIEMLSPESSLIEISAIRKRIVDTVILGKGTNSSANAAALENTDDLPVAAKAESQAVDRWLKCKVCGNNDQSLFAMDRKNGDMICTECGTVAMESLMHEGSQFRKFEGEADRNHHGDTPNMLYSNAHNMSTTLGGMAGGGMGMMGSGKGRGGSGLENVLRNAHAYTEMNISQFGKEEKKTRIGYKDRQKKDAFMKMNHVGDALNLHDAVVQRAKELFAGFRDDRELVQQFKGVVAACLWEAFDQLSRDGKRILKVRAGDIVDDNDDLTNGEEEELGTGRRATWRQAMHNSTAASKGDAFFKEVPDYLKQTRIMGNDNNSASNNVESTSATTTESELERKSVASWDLDDVRSWLLEASRAIAKQWIELRKQQQQKEGNNLISTSTTENGESDDIHGGTTKIPSGTLEELEGQLVELTFVLCDFLEQEIQKKGGTTSSRTTSTTTNGGTNAQKKNHLRVTTPRVNMAHLGIRWQGSHERGSGGKGGVGNSGRSVKGTKPGESIGNTRTAGQILILNTKKLSTIVKDTVAGEAFYKELRAILARQDSLKRRDRSNINAQRRFHQMNRKPWMTKK